MENTQKTKLGLSGERPAIREEAPRPDLRAEFRPDPRVVDAINEVGQVTDYFGYDEALRPPEFEYHGKLMTYVGLEARKHQADMKRLGWTFVPRDRHPECATDDPADKIILINGLALMERHVYYGQQTRKREERANAALIGAQLEKIQEEGDTLFPRKGGKLDKIAKITQEYGPADPSIIPA
jgi:hypothetical protein